MFRDIHKQQSEKPADKAACQRRQEEIFKAQICEQSSRYDEMAVIMKEVGENYLELTSDERNLLSCAYKNVIGSRRSSWRVLNSFHEVIIDPSNLNNVLTDKQFEYSRHANETHNFDVRIVKDYMSQIETEIRYHCKVILTLLSKRLIPSSTTNGESRVFYYKMKGDFMRYLSEVCGGSERKEKANEALLAYKTASERALIDLPPTHPVRLGLMLNFSVFYFDLLNQPDRSCSIAKKAFDDAIAELDTLSEESYHDSTIIMQLLRDNLVMWAQEANKMRQQEQKRTS